MTAVIADRIEGRFFEDEHRRIRHGLALLAETIDVLDRSGRDEGRDRVARIVGWLRRDLLPHVAWEEAWLYPRLDAEAGSPWASRSLRLEHDQLRELGRRLEATFEEVEAHWTTRIVFDLVAALARVEAIVTAHLRNEDAIVVPLLEGTIQQSEATGRH